MIRQLSSYNTEIQNILNEEIRAFRGKVQYSKENRGFLFHEDQAKTVQFELRKYGVEIKIEKKDFYYELTLVRRTYK